MPLRFVRIGSDALQQWQRGTKACIVDPRRCDRSSVRRTGGNAVFCFICIFTLRSRKPHLAPPLPGDMGPKNSRELVELLQLVGPGLVMAFPEIALWPPRTLLEQAR